MKNYEEIANSVLNRQKNYIVKRKKIRKTILSVVASLTCCAIIFTSGFGLWKSGIFNNNCNVTEKPQNNNTSNNNPTGNNSQNNSTDGNNQDSSTVTPPYVDDTSDIAPPVDNDCFIDSIDKLNFYSAKQILSENSLLPLSSNYRSVLKSPIMNLSWNYAEYPIDPNKVFTVTMVTYFTINLNDERGFLAQKLGGTGLVEVVVNNSDIDPLGAMITFKKGDKYYSCLSSGGGVYYPDFSRSYSEFSTYKYIDGFNIIKNFNQDNFIFKVNFGGNKVVGFECRLYEGDTTIYSVDDVTLNKEFCIVFFTKQHFTINQLEMYFKNEEDVL